MQEAPARLIPEPWPRHESPGDESGTRRRLTNRPQIGRAASCHRFFSLFSVGVLGKLLGGGGGEGENATGATGGRTTG